MASPAAGLAGRVRRWWRSWRSAPALVHSPRYALAVPGSPADPHRGQHILAALSWHGLAHASHLLEPQPATLADLLRVHTPAWIEQLGSPEAVQAALGLELTREEAEAAVELQRLMVGGTLAAARQALRAHGLAVNLAGGLHHARPGRGGGHCLLNDVAVAVAALRAAGFAGRVLVVDLDLHDGNGTREAFARDPTVHTFSIHNVDWDLDTAVESTSLALGPHVDDARYLQVLAQALPAVVERVQPELVFYLAGADVAADDTLGDWLLTPEGVLRRDQLVMQELRGLAHPPGVVVLLAGGYGRHAWRYGARFLFWLLGGRELPLPPEEDLLLCRLRALRRGAGPQGSFTLEASDLPGLEGLQPKRFLGAFSRHGAELALERAGLLEALRARGFRELRVELGTGGEGGDTLRVLCADEEPELLVELRAHRSRAEVPGLELVVVEWLLLQNPRATFSVRRPRLPGQEHPGLGLLDEVLGLLVVACEQLRLDGLFFRVSHYTTAALGRALLRALDPAAEGRLRAFARAVGGLPLAEAARLVEGGLVQDAAGRPLAWQPAALLLPVSAAARAVVSGPDYEARVAEALALPHGAWA